MMAGGKKEEDIKERKQLATNSYALDHLKIMDRLHSSKTAVTFAFELEVQGIFGPLFLSLHSTDCVHAQRFVKTQLLKNAVFRTFVLLCTMCTSQSIRPGHYYCLKKYT